MGRKDHTASARQQKISWIPWLRSSCWLSLTSIIAYLAFRTFLMLQAENVGLIMWISIVTETSAICEGPVQICS